MKHILFITIIVALVAGLAGCGYPWFPKTKVDPARVSNERTGQTKISISPPPAPPAPSAADSRARIEPAVLPENTDMKIAKPVGEFPVDRHIITGRTDTPIDIKVGDKTIKAPSGSTVNIQFDEHGEAKGQGSGYSTAGDAVKADTSAPTASLGQEGGMSSTGGGLDLDVKSLLRSGSVLYWLGGIAILVGLAVAFALKQYVWGGALAVGGLVLIGVAVMFESYPWVVFVGLAVLIGLAVWYYLRVRRNGQTTATLATVVQAVEAAPASAAASIKSHIAAYAAQGGLAGVVKKVVGKVKNALPPAPPVVPPATPPPVVPPTA